MNLIDLFWMLLFIGGGALAGSKIITALAYGPAWVGAVGGAIVGYLLLVLVSNWNSP